MGKRRLYEETRVGSPKPCRLNNPSFHAASPSRDSALFRQRLRRVPKRRVCEETKLDERVRERTEQLRMTNHQLTGAYDQQVFLTRQMAKGGQSILSTINGLCHVAALDLQDEKAKGYLQKVAENTDQLSAFLGRLRI